MYFACSTCVAVDTRQPFSQGKCRKWSCCKCNVHSHDNASPMLSLPLQEEKWRAVLPLSSATQGSMLSSCRSVRTDGAHHDQKSDPWPDTVRVRGLVSAYLCLCHCCLQPPSVFSQLSDTQHIGRWAQTCWLDPLEQPFIPQCALLTNDLRRKRRTVGVWLLPKHPVPRLHDWLSLCTFYELMADDWLCSCETEFPSE